MSSPEACNPMIATAFVPELGRHWPKRLARLVGVPTETARFWVYHRMPEARRAQVARAILAECDKLEAAIAETRRRWGEIAGDEAAGAVGGRPDDAPGAPTRRMGGGVT